MVTTKKYLEAYFNAIHERNSLLIKKIGQKSKMDVRMLKGTPTDAQAAEMIAWIGTSNEPIKGKIAEQPIRNLLWKIIKSSNFFKAKIKEIEAKAAAEKAKLPKKLSKAIDAYLETITDVVPTFENFALRLSEVYQKEVAALSAKDYATYKSLVTQEITIATEFQESRQSAIAKIYSEFSMIMHGMAMLEETSIAAFSITFMSIAVSAAVVTQFVADLPTATALIAGIATVGSAASVGLIRIFKSAAVM